MKTTFVLAKREFTSFFASPIALAFLGLFLIFTLVTFFNIDFFFSYGLADVRSLFANMPVLMIILVAALTMKLWSEEQKQGTLEILLTLPLSNFQLVVGKFLAGWAFIIVALLFTLGLPLTVAAYGPLDWGPVWGGYFAAIFMGAAYLAIGLCVSSLTDNQVLSLMLTISIGLVFYAIGHAGVAEMITSMVAPIIGIFMEVTKGFEHRVEDVLLSFGTGSRFKSIEKGLLDSRDLFWYVSIALFFLFLNAYFLNRKRQLTPGSSLKLNSLIMVMLVGVNLICANIAMSPSPIFRMDLTESKMFSLSDETMDQIQDLDEVLTIEMVFSADMPEFLRPLVPQVKDLVDEYRIQSRGKLRVELAEDPNEDAILARDLLGHYRVFPYNLVEKNSTTNSVIKTYFHLILKYGDRYRVLSMQDLIQTREDTNGIHYSLRNLEYELSRGIRKLFNQFQNYEAIFSRIKEDPFKVRLYYPFRAMQQTENTEILKNYLANFNKVMDQIEEQGKEGFDFKEVDFSPMLMGQKKNPEIFQRLNIRAPKNMPMVITLEHGERATTIEIDLEDGHREIGRKFLDKAQGMLPDFMRTVGLWVPGPATAKQANRMKQEYRFIRLHNFLSTIVNVKRIDFEENKGRIPDDVDLLLVMGVEKASLNERFAFDQFVMQGKPVIFGQGYTKIVERWKRDPADRNPPWYEITHSKHLGDILRDYGVVVSDYIAQDRRCFEFIDYKNYALNDKVADRGMIDVRHPELSLTHDATKNMRGGILMAWSSPLFINENLPGKIETLVKTTKQSWKLSLQDWRNESNSPFVGHQPLAVTITGKRQSFFKDINRLQKNHSPGDFKEYMKMMERGYIKEQKNVRVAVIGSHDFVSDIGWVFLDSAGWKDQQRMMGRRLFPEYAVKMHQNLQFIGNLVDWGLKEDKFKNIKRVEASARLLEPMDAKTKRNFQFMNYGIVLGLLVVVLIGFWMLRKLKAPMIDFSQGEVK